MKTVTRQQFWCAVGKLMDETPVEERRAAWDLFEKVDWLWAEPRPPTMQRRDDERHPKGD